MGKRKKKTGKKHGSSKKKVSRIEQGNKPGRESKQKQQNDVVTEAVKKEKPVTKEEPVAKEEQTTKEKPVTKEEPVAKEEPVPGKNDTELQKETGSREVLENVEQMEKKTFSWKKSWKIFGGAVFGVLVISYISGMIYYQDKFWKNTTINGIDMSYDTVDEAEKKISDMVGRYAIRLEERNGESETIQAGQIGYHYVSQGEVQNYKDSQKSYLWPVSLLRSSEYYFTSSTSFDNEKLEETVDALKCFDKDHEVAPTNACMKFNGTTYEMVKETQGKKVRKRKLKNLLHEAITKSQTVLDLEKEDCYARPGITEKNKVLNRTIKNMNRYAETRIVYLFGGIADVLDGSIISKWLSYDDKGQVTLSEEKVALYVDYLAGRYDTGGKEREFTTHDGSVVTVKGGRYGWIIDREEETEELKQLISEGARTTRYPVYAQTAASRENSDLGKDYVEVDLTNQHLWMYIDGEEIVSTDVVSGTYTNPSRRTPSGTYALYYKKSPAVLRSNTPGDSYESPVTYWMPFNGGIGLHDANWRGSFGGSIYQYSGSHGCVNLPTGAAREIYNNIYVGMPIICYYR